MIRKTRVVLLGAAGTMAAALALTLPAHSQAAADGAQLFADNCSACHQADAKGIPGAFPALAGDAFVIGDPHKVAETIINGRGGMPSFKDSLTDAQLAAIVSYVRANFGNNAPPVPAEVFAEARAGKPMVESKPLPAH